MKFGAKTTCIPIMPNSNSLILLKPKIKEAPRARLELATW